ncbi:MAG: TetR family transcriptional regulator [Gemmobacter sp.]|jgi:AcrR family transcriptional regulator|nr:TetR family transcriptional regulator [Gemmobacter sp.]
MKKTEVKGASSRMGKYNVATPEKLLDAAEVLFASRHFDGVSLQMIAEKAGTNVGQIVYHFGRKEALLRQTILRRSMALNEDRLRLLTSYQLLVGKENVEVGPLIRAFLEPYYERLRSDEDQWRHFALFISRTAWDERVSTYMRECFDDVAHRYLDAFQAAIPTLNRRNVVRGFQFMLAAMHASTAMDARFRHMLAGDDENRDLRADYEEYYASIVPFIIGGFEALR